MQDITKIDVIGKAKLDWLDNWDDYKKIQKYLKRFIDEEWIQNFRYRHGIGGWEIETIYTQMTMYDIEKFQEAFKDSIYCVSSIGLNYDLIEVKKIRPNVCVTISYKI